MELVSAEQFKRIRKRKNLTQAQVARLLKTTIRTISRWETGARKVPHIATMAIEGLKARTVK
jgi:transcriptional regulator with XRE-family HTH domain